MYIKPRGTKDWDGEEIQIKNDLINSVKKFFFQLNYEEVETPIFEFKSLFDKSLGESTDIITNEMFSFYDKKGREFVLRPEVTASTTRYMIENKYFNNQNLPKNIYQIGAMFRYDRPQKGRYRQFNQISVENYYSNFSINQDLLNILSAVKLLKKLNIKNIKVKINNLGDENIISKYKKKLNEYFKNNNNKLSSESKNRLKLNPMRILDSKDDNDVALIENIPKIFEIYNNEIIKNNEFISNNLKKLGIEFEWDYSLVRGLDYYEGIIFEIIINDSKNSLVGGGRYNKLIKNMDNKDISALGFAAGIERIMENYSMNKSDNKNLIYVAPLSLEASTKVIGLLNNNNLVTDLNENNISNHLKIIKKLNIDKVIWINDEALKNNSFSIVEFSTKKIIKKDLSYLNLLKI